jgi:hypothetical protein
VVKVWTTPDEALSTVSVPEIVKGPEVRTFNGPEVRTCSGPLVSTLTAVVGLLTVIAVVGLLIVTRAPPDVVIGSIPAAVTGSPSTNTCRC